MSIFSKLRDGLITRSADEARGFAADVGALLEGDTILALHGNLGVGKTTFVQGLAHGLGVRESVTSPTFTIFNIHQGSRHRLVHLDAYRLEAAAQVEQLMLEDFLVSPYCLAVEWPEKIAAWLPPETLHLDLWILQEGQHRIQLRGT